MAGQLGFLRLAVSSAKEYPTGTDAPIHREAPISGLSSPAGVVSFEGTSMPSGGPTSRMVTSVGKQAPKTKTAPDEVSCRITSSAAKSDQLPEPAPQPHQRCGIAAKQTGHQ
jgi:hypothetical protein